MNILIDARMIAWPGIGRYTERLLEHLQSLDEAHTYTVLMLPADKARWRPSNDRFSLVYADIRPYGLAEQTRLPRLLNRLKPDLVHFLHFTAPVAYRGRYVVTIHDLILLRYQNLRGNALRRLKYRSKHVVMRRAIRSAAKRAVFIITDTHFVKDDIIATLGAPITKVKVIPLASDTLIAEAQPITKPHLGSDYLLYVGSFFPYKNIAALIDALKLLVTTRPGLKLILAGKVDSFADRLKNHAASLGVADQVIFTGYVSDGELVWLYQHAAAYVFPSLSEGFGLPGLEAMSQGTPVISSNASCLPEVYADAAHYFNPYSTADMAAKIAEVLDDPKLQQQLRMAGNEHLKDFSWEAMAKRTLELYQQALDRS
jgi:glycosyltransferase involved in cell wall biosynthesis